MLNIYIGWDSSERAAYNVCKYSIERRTTSPINILPLKHTELRRKGLFSRAWLTESTTGIRKDLVDNKPFSTEFSHTRFLVPHLNNYKGWALFMDCDMLFTSDIKELINRIDDKYAIMCVKHRQKVAEGSEKMEGQVQLNYFRKNWSSFVLWNCSHPLNKQVNLQMINSMPGSYLHAFEWVPENLIGHIGYEYNWIENSSPVMHLPKVIHYTEGGPWFDDVACHEVVYGDMWLKEYEHYMVNVSNAISNVPSVYKE